MADVHDPQVRSYNMSRIRNKNTKPEITVRKFLYQSGLRYRLHDSKLPGKPDIVLKKYNTIIFIHGCFWHGHEGCKYFVIPKTKTQWWLDKISRNKEKDTENYEKLVENNWNIITIWECELRKGKLENTLTDLVIKIKGFR